MSDEWALGITFVCLGGRDILPIKTSSVVARREPLLGGRQGREEAWLLVVSRSLPSPEPFCYVLLGNKV